MSEIRAVVFDFGGVVFDWNAEYLYRDLIPDEAEAELIAQHPDHAELIRAFYGQWPKTLRGVLEDGVELVERLHAAEIPLYGLTNWSAETFPHVEHRYDFLKRFRHIVVSGRVKMLKPEPRIYAHLMEHVGEQPGAAVFIDDVAHNVEGARAFGMQAILHRSGAETAAALRALGVQF